MKHLLLLLLATASSVACTEVRNTAIRLFSPEYEPDSAADRDQVVLRDPAFVGTDRTRVRIPVELVRVASGLPQITDIQFFPGSDHRAIALTKQGSVHYLDIAEGTSRELARLDVVTDSEMGLLGAALAPNIDNDGRLFLHRNIENAGRIWTRIEEWQLSWINPGRPDNVSFVQLVFEIEQPYSNHNAGQLAVGPDGYLYFGLGDGGWREDPHNHGQNPLTALGSIFRLDISRPGGPYPPAPDGPFAGDAAYLPGTWAIGLRNPWRFSFGLDGRMIVADVGQYKWEEISIVEPGDNLGWRFREGSRCFAPQEKCQSAGLVGPVYEYGRDDGSSITGGYILMAGVPDLVGSYVFGDFVSGRLWAISLPADRAQAVTAGAALALGKWPILISTFGRDATGRIYAGDYDSGNIYQLRGARDQASSEDS